MLLGVRLLVGALIGKSSKASLFDVSLMSALTALITESVLIPNGFPCQDTLSSISGKNLPLKAQSNVKKQKKQN